MENKHHKKVADDTRGSSQHLGVTKTPVNISISPPVYLPRLVRTPAIMPHSLRKSMLPFCHEHHRHMRLGHRHKRMPSLKGTLSVSKLNPMGRPCLKHLDLLMHKFSHEKHSCPIALFSYIYFFFRMLLHSLPRSTRPHGRYWAGGRWSTSAEEDIFLSCQTLLYPKMEDLICSAENDYCHAPQFSSPNTIHHHFHYLISYRASGGEKEKLFSSSVSFVVKIQDS